MAKLIDVWAPLIKWCEDHDLDPSEYRRWAEQQPDGSVVLERYVRGADGGFIRRPDGGLATTVERVTPSRPFPWDALNVIIGL